MTHTKPPTSFRISPLARNLLSQLAKQEHRSMVNLIEHLIATATKEGSTLRAPGPDFDHWHGKEGATVVWSTRMAPECLETLQRLGDKWGRSQADVIEYLIWTYSQKGGV